MSEYRRYFVPGATYFFTVVTLNREPIFRLPAARRRLGRVFRKCAQAYPFDVIAIVLLPDHLHAIWAMPSGDNRYALRWSWIKGNFTRDWVATGGAESERTTAHAREGRRGVWQRRYWEHLIRDEADLEAHFDYVHYNPVKHGLVARPCDWQWSSFHRWVRSGHYPEQWGANLTLAELPNGGGE